jgi:hypothetical protein
MDAGIGLIDASLPDLRRPLASTARNLPALMSSPISHVGMSSNPSP